MFIKVGVLLACASAVVHCQGDIGQQLRQAGYDVVFDRGDSGNRARSSVGNYGDAQRSYEYGYQLDDTQGSHGHVEKRDDNGRVEGEYSINLGDGRVRVVKYVADENGYRADITTDELGTESKNPNDVYIGSTAISGYEAALKYGPFAPPHIETPLEPYARPEAARVAKKEAVDTRVNLPTYGTFAAHG